MLYHHRPAPTPIPPSKSVDIHGKYIQQLKEMVHLWYWGAYSSGIWKAQSSCHMYTRPCRYLDTLSLHGDVYGLSPFVVQSLPFKNTRVLREPTRPTSCEALFWAPANSMHKNIHPGAHGCRRVTRLEWEGSRRVALSSGLCLGVLEVKHDLDRTGMKK